MNTKIIIKQDIENIIGDKNFSVGLKSKKIKNKELYDILKNLYKCFPTEKEFPKTLEDVLNQEAAIKGIYISLKDDIETQQLFHSYIKDIIIKSFFEYIEEYIKTNNSFPFTKDSYIKRFIKTYDISAVEFLKILNFVFKKKVTKDGKSSVKMKKVFFEEYSKHKDLFESYFIGSLLKKNKKTMKDFEEIGLKMQKKIEFIENEVLKKMEGGQYSDMSVSVSDKYKKYINLFYPYAYKVGVKTRILSKKEMKEYLDRQNKK